MQIRYSGIYIAHGGPGNTQKSYNFLTFYAMIIHTHFPNSCDLLNIVVVLFVSLPSIQILKYINVSYLLFHSAAYKETSCIIPYLWLTLYNVCGDRNKSFNKVPLPLEHLSFIISKPIYLITRSICLRYIIELEFKMKLFDAYFKSKPIQ